jgi:hypothetical protein
MDTSLKNSKGLYCLEQQLNNRQLDFSIYKYKCVSNDTRIPCAGINMPMMTSGYNNNVLSNNASDIESALFGIGSTNLVKNKAPVVPELNKLNQAKFFNNMNVFLPEPLVVESKQRAKGPFC